MGWTFAYAVVDFVAICEEGMAEGFGEGALEVLPCVETGLGGASARKREVSSEMW